MASIMPFPNVATHRRMPHLSNTPRSPPTLQSEPSSQIDPSTALNGQGLPSSASLSSQKAIQDASQPRLLADGASSLDDPAPLQPALPPSSSSMSVSASASPAMASQDPKLIKSALYDAFGCLYHPSAHTKYSTSSNALALRSGDVTPLMGLSPKASPLLRPNVGPSAPITPLELSDDSSTGYFALHQPPSGLPSSSTITNSSNNSSSTHGSSRHHHHHHHRSSLGSSNLSSTFTSGDFSACSTPGHRSPLSLSRRQSVDLTLDPAEHPVLCSLQTLSITHPHPTEHYRQHLGHDLGHDRIPMDDSDLTLSPAAGPVAATKSPSSTSLNKPAGPSSNLFPMDRNEHDSIPEFGQQGLVQHPN